MRLVATPDGAVNRIDRALWLTLLFDRAFHVFTTPACRIFAVAAEDRAFAVAAEDRIYEVTCG